MENTAASSFLNQLNDKQKLAVQEENGAILVLAGAGSGKTKVLTSRIINLIQKGTSPYSILALTFTNKAANEMKERLAKMNCNVNDIWVSTFHSMCVRILRRHITSLKSSKSLSGQVNFDNNFSIYKFIYILYFLFYIFYNKNFIIGIFFFLFIILSFLFISISNDFLYEK